jgi:hypothetical protein
MEIKPGRPVSKSGVSLFNKCAFYYYCLYILGFKDEPGDAAKNGILTHAWRAKVFGGEVTADFALANAENEEVQFLTKLAIAHDPYTKAKTRELEQETRINSKGECVEDINLAVARGFLDDQARFDYHMVVDDLKTGKWEYDDPFERNLYAGLLAKAKNLDCFEIHFVRSFCRSGNRPTWIYKWSTRLGVGKVEITHPNGKIEELLSCNLNPLVDTLNSTIEQIRNSEPTPNPGRQCQNWFGQGPCQFRDTICPHFHPDAELVISLPAQKPANQSLIEAKDAITAVKLADGDDLIALDNITVSRAYEACLTVAAGIKQLEKKIKQWAETNGPIVIGDATYGWHPEIVRKINEQLAMKMILESNMEIEDILKCVNVSKSSIEKISKRKWGELRQAILDAATLESPETKDKFGLIGGK